MSDSVILWTIAFQAPPSMGFSRQEYWDSLDKNTGVGCYSILQGISLTQGYNPHLLHHLHWQGVLYITWEAWFHYIYCPFANWLVYLFKVELREVFQCVCVCVCVCVCDVQMTPLVVQMVKNLPEMQELWVQSLGPEDPLEKEMAIHSVT